MAWFKEWFDTEYYHILYKNRDKSEAESFISKLLQQLNLPKSSFVIDLACGKGRHSEYLSDLGYKVLGLDLSENSIRKNKERENSQLSFHVHDMREPITQDLTAEKADAVFNLFTSFGYFDTEAEDHAVFRAVKNVLKDNGYFVLDFLNASRVEKNLVKKETKTRGTLDFHIERKIEDEFVVKDIRFEDNGQAHHYQERVRLHSLEEIQALGEKAGLSYVQVFGDYSLGNYTEESPRCILIFRNDA